jgi:hypothetical protein
MSGGEAHWLPSKKLYLLAVGVSTYPCSGGAARDLPGASKDAQKLAEAFEAQGKQTDPSTPKLFSRVVTRVLTDETRPSATKQVIFDELRTMQKLATIYDLVVVSLAGHGDLDRADLMPYWFFTPHDYDARQVDSTAVFWTRGLDRFLPHFASDVVLLLDTCHSGGATKEMPLENVFRSQGRRGMVVIAAALSEETAKELGEGGALTLAVREGISGKYLPGLKSGKHAPPPLPVSAERGGDVTLEELGYYVKRRVNGLVGGEQSVVITQRADFDAQKITIARIPKGGDKKP